MQATERLKSAAASNLKLSTSDFRPSAAFELLCRAVDIYLLF
ncbi:hypothetical protein ACKFKG_25315 [Phormidesmis sp. 146-35]